MQKKLKPNSKPKLKPINLELLNKELLGYVWPGYDLYFVHGWFAAYLSSPSDSEEDLLIPGYLILDETKITDEQHFSRLVDQLVVLYSELADAIYERNKLIRPLIDFKKPNSFDQLSPDWLQLSKKSGRNLLNWLYGYLSAYLAISSDLEQYAVGDNLDNLLKDKFYPALFTLCIALFSLTGKVHLTAKSDNSLNISLDASPSSEINLDDSPDNSSDGSLADISENVSNDLSELLIDIKSMWESIDGEGDIDEIIVSAIDKLKLADIVTALNNIFYVTRLIDENKFNQSIPPNSLLSKLSTKH